MDDKKICFIACVNDRDLFAECLNYIERLYVPDGFTLDALSIEDAKSMTAGYNGAMHASDAMYKIYLHQDTFITDRYFLCELIDIFDSDEKIGMVGVVGTPKMPEDGCMWNADRTGSPYSDDNKDVGKCNEYFKLSDYKLVEVEAIDGFLMATRADTEWREDLFKQFDFYDASQSAEFIRKGYKVVVPVMDKPVCVHDDGVIVNLINYDDNRKIYLKEYM